MREDDGEQWGAPRWIKKSSRQVLNILFSRSSVKSSCVSESGMPKRGSPGKRQVTLPLLWFAMILLGALSGDKTNEGAMKRDKGDEEGDDAFADEKNLQLLLLVAEICDDD